MTIGRSKEYKRGDHKQVKESKINHNLDGSLISNKLCIVEIVDPKPRALEIIGKAFVHLWS